MKLTFLGATHEVTGSCTLLECGGSKLLIDCGMQQGVDAFENEPLPVAASAIDYVLLTHAHIDHTGNLPLLYKNGFRGTVFATSASCSLCDIMLRDCAHIQISEAEYATRKAKRAGAEPVEPVYDLNDVEGLLKHLRPCEYGETVRIGESVTARFTDIGHLLGSACIELHLVEGDAEKTLVFSGDVGNTAQPIINDPQTVAKADYLVIESTYGDRLHEQNRTDHVHALAGYIQRTLDRGGNVIIPSFAVGRTQEMLYFIRQIKNEGLVKGHDGFPVYVDSPLANEATSVFLQCDVSCLDPETREIMARGENPLVFPGLHTYVTTGESKELNVDATPKVIISASGMCDAGRIKHHLKYNLWRKECLVLFVGYQAQGTLGRKIYDGAKTVRLFGDDIAVNAEVALLSNVSGHADKQGLIDWLGAFEEKPKQIFVNHGDDDSCTAFTKCLNDERGYTAFAPFSGTEYDLAKGDFTRVTEGVPVKKKSEARTASNSAYTRLASSVQRLEEIVKKCGDMPNKKLAKFADQIDAIVNKWNI